MSLDAELGLAPPEKSTARRPRTDFSDAAVEERKRARIEKSNPPIDPTADPIGLAWPDGRIHGMFASAPNPVQWFAHERLLAGRGHVLTGVGGSSKTTMLYALAQGAVLGRLPWDWTLDRTGSAALFLTEDTLDDVHRTLHLLGQQLDKAQQGLMVQRLRIYPLAGLPARLLQLNGNALVETEVYDWLMQQLQGLPEPLAFVGIDPALGVTEGDEMSPAHQRRLGELVDRIAIESGACTVLATHSTKAIHQLDEVGSHASRGSGAITDAVRGEFVLRNMTADEARRFGVEDRAERQRYVQLTATKGNRLPPEAFVPVWLKRGAGGLLSQVSLEQVERGSVGQREVQALEILRQACVNGDTTLKFWREQCAAAGVINKAAGLSAQEKAMQRIRDALMDAGMVRHTGRGMYQPT